MVRYFSFNILKPTWSSSFRKYFLSVVSYTAKYSLHVKGNLLALWFNLFCSHCTVHTLNETSLFLGLMLHTVQLAIPNRCELLSNFPLDHSIAVANIFVTIHIASAPSLNFRGICDAFLKQCSRIAA